jgi:hypothetical protein
MSNARLTVVANDVEAEFVCGLMRSNGMSCWYRKTNVGAAIGAESGGFAVAGPTEVLVADSDLAAARKLVPEA